MAKGIVRHIPNAVTCCNLFSGCIACVYAFEGDFTLSLLFIVLGAVFDFFDGMTARLLKAYSPMGKELDSLADSVTFGLAPSLILFTWLRHVGFPQFFAPFEQYIPFLAFFLAVFSVLRLAKFNIDERQTSSFIGLPTPANALFWAAFAVGLAPQVISLYAGWILLLGLLFISCYLLTSEIPMFSLKFKNLHWKGNQWQFIFLGVSLLLLIFLGCTGLAAVIVWYIILSIIQNFSK